MKTKQFLIPLMLAAVCVSVRAADGGKPNFVYILMDDAGYGDLSCYGQEKFETPNIDALAAAGMRFTDHYAGSTVCAPTRCSLMSGLHTGHTFVRGNREHKPEGQEPIPDALVTIPEVLKTAGYRSGGFGKWGLGFPGSEGDPMKQGFDDFYGYNCQREAHSYYPDHLWDGFKRVEMDGKTYAHDPIMEQGLEFIKESKDGPFFCFLPVTIPHAAMHVPEEYAAPFRKKFPQFEDKVGKYAGPPVKNPVAAFAGMMTKLDEDVGRLVALLDELGLSENTVVMLTSDNGPHKEGGHDPLFFNSNGQYKGHKRDLYEGGVRVPFIVKWPGKVKAGTTSDFVCAHWDIMPTFCELSGAKAPENTDGVSLVPTLTGRPDDQEVHKYLYWEFFEQGGKRAARWGKWKAVQNGLHKAPNGPVELYDLEKDPGEENNVAGSHPELVDQAKKIFLEAHTPSKEWPFANIDG